MFLTEIWQKDENRRHMFAIEELFEMRQIKYISTARPGGRRGGGVAITYSEERYQVSKLNIEVKKPLECLFALVKAKDTTINKNKAKQSVPISFMSDQVSRCQGIL